MRTLWITPKGDKGRSFGATLLAYATADALWPGGSTGTAIRPVWMMLAGSDTELRPFVANLKTGHTAEPPGKSDPGKRFELLRSAGYTVSWQKTEVGSVATLYLPDLFRIEPGMVDPAGMRFCMLPEEAWLEPLENSGQRPPPPKFRDWLVSNRNGFDAHETWPKISRLAPLFTAYVNRRTRCPIVPDPAFHERLFVACMAAGMVAFAKPLGDYCTTRFGWVCEDTADVGLATGLAFVASHDDFETLLAAETAEFFTSHATVARDAGRN